MHLAPIVLFVYNRPWHTRQTVEALQANDLACESELFVYSDAPADPRSGVKVQEVRKYVRCISGFKKVVIIERDKNIGLASSIIEGVTTVIKRYGKAIVLEDDLVTSPHFLWFMNSALVVHERNKKIWHISGWGYPFESEGLGDVFLSQVMNCWGWATWADRWEFFDKDVDLLLSKFDRKMIREFDLNGSGVFWSQVIGNKRGDINTWAIFWYATIFLKKGLCLIPTAGYVNNIGHDGSGVHCGNIGSQTKVALTGKGQVEFGNCLTESLIAKRRILEYHRRKIPFYGRVINKICRMVIGRNLFSARFP